MTRPTTRLSLVGIALGIALGCAGGGGRCGPAKPVGTDTVAVDRAVEVGKLPAVADPASITEDELDAIVAFLVPFVEEAGGARFTSIPDGQLAANADVLSDVLAEESRSILGTIYDVPPEMIDRMAEGSRAGIPGLLGKYATSTGKVYLEPRNTAMSAAANPDLGEGGALDVVLLIMAHELGHALQDQVGDLDKVMGALEDLDHFDGMRGITEGQANWITLRVARKLGKEDAFWALSKGQGWGRDGLIHDGAFPVWMLYGQGLAFCEHHAEHGGTDKLWEIVKAPPRSTTMLFRPERYAPAVQVPEGIGQSLAGVEQELTRTQWVVADTHLGEAPLRQETLGLPAERVEEVLGAIRWGWERRMFVSGDPNYGPRNASLQVVQFDSGEHARALVDLLSDGLQAQADARTDREAEMAKVFPGMSARTWVVEAVPYDRVAGDAVLRRVVGPRSASGARASVEEEQALWVVRGPRLVVVTVSGFRPGNRLDKAVDRLFTQLDALPTAPPDGPGGTPAGP